MSGGMEDPFLGRFFNSHDIQTVPEALARAVDERMNQPVRVKGGKAGGTYWRAMRM